MSKYIRTNSYIDKMACTYLNKCSKNNRKCQCRKYCNCTPENNCGCSSCGVTMFGPNTINAYTPKIPPKIGFDYTNMLYPTDYPYVYYYGSMDGKLFNHR